MTESTLYVGIFIYGTVVVNNLLVKAAGKYVTKSEWYRVLGFGLVLSAISALVIDKWILG